MCSETNTSCPNCLWTRALGAHVPTYDVSRLIEQPLSCLVYCHSIRLFHSCSPSILGQLISIVHSNVNGIITLRFDVQPQSVRMFLRIDTTGNYGSVVWLCDCVIVCLCDCVIVWLCVCVIVWLCDCVIVCLCDCVIVWLCVCVFVWLCDCVIVWLCDCVIVWLCDCVIVWLCDCVIVWLCFGLCITSWFVAYPSK